MRFSLLEELGHGVDWKLHPSLDTLGDEGEIFSDLVRGVELSESELQRIKTEDDRVMINIDGQTLGLEQATSIFLSNLPSARGIYVDSYNNVLVSELVVNSQTFTPESWIAKYNSNAQLINAKILGGTTVIKLAAAPSFGGVIGLRDDGLVFSLDPNTLTSRQLFNLRQISVDTSAVYNFTNQNLETPSSGVYTQYSNYNDIAVRQDGNATEIFVTGQIGVTGSLPFIMRIRFENNTVQEAKVLLNGVRSQFLGSGGAVVSVPAPGIAVNSQGQVITTLPIAPVPGQQYTGISLITFPANFDPDDGIQSDELKILSNGVDSFGMTTDTQGTSRE